MVDATAEQKISVCDLMKNDSAQVVKKLESTVPVFIQNYSDLFSEFLKMYENMFATCYIAERNFFDKLNIDQQMLHQIKDSSEQVKNQTLTGIDVGTRLFDISTKMRISSIHAYDNYIQTMMESYANMLATFNKTGNY